MSEYERLINYLNSVINDITDRRSKIEEKNVNNSIVKSSLSNIINLIVNHKLELINIDELGRLLDGLMSEEEINDVKNKLIDLTSMQLFLFDNSITNPIKKIMIRDLNNIYARLSFIRDSIYEISVPIEDIKLEKECRKYLSILDEKGYIRLLSNEERIAYYKFLQDNNIEDALFLITKYIMYANRNMKRVYIVDEEKEKINDKEDKIIDDPVREFKDKREIGLSKEEKEKREKEFKLAYDKILILLEIYENIDKEVYQKYSNYFANMDIYDIYSNRSDFLTVDGINYNMAIPCIKERIIPNIDYKNKALVFKLFSEIIALSNDVLVKYEEDKKKRELIQEKERLEKKIYDEKVDSFKLRYLPIKELYDSFSDKIKDVIVKVESSTTYENRLSLMELLNNPDNILFKFYQINRDELMMYVTYSKIKKNIDLIEKELNRENDRITDEDFSFLDEVLEETNEYIKEIDLYQIDDNEIANIDDDSSIISNGRQYENGNNVILFYRHDEYEPFMIEDDINSINDGNAMKEVNIKTREILKRLNDISFIDLNKGYSKFLQLIRERQEQNSNAHSFRCELTGKEYPFYRLSLREDVRLSCLKVEVSSEMQKKLNISKRHVFIVMGLQYIVNHDNAKGDSYTKFINELEREHDGVNEIIALLEGKKENDELLYRLLNDSSLLYDSFREKAKGLGD